MRPGAGKPWSCPELWPGATVFVLGGGPSLVKADVDRLQGRRVIAVNCAFLLAPWADFFLWADSGWFNKYGAPLADLPGVKVTIDQRISQREGLRVMERHVGTGCTRKRSALTWNGNSGAAAINLALHLGARRIVLLGFDMRLVQDPETQTPRANFHDLYLAHAAEEKAAAAQRGTRPPRRRHDPYSQYMDRFPAIMDDLGRAGVELVNATPLSALARVPRTTLDEELARPERNP